MFCWTYRKILLQKDVVTFWIIPVNSEFKKCEKDSNKESDAIEKSCNNNSGFSFHTTEVFVEAEF